MNDYLISDPAERRKRAQEKEQWVLEFLRDEIYSTTAILAVEMAVGERAARDVLARMEKRGLLVRDEIRFMGSRAIPLWGITTAGVLEGLTPEEVASVNLRYHTPGRVSPLTIEHTLAVQRCRQYCELEMNCEDWVPTRRLPAQNEKKNHPARWAVYPDGVLMRPSTSGQLVPFAIEVERTRKTPLRYVQIIRGHLSNIEKNHYRRVMYFCPRQKDCDSLQALFLRLMQEKKITLWAGETQRYGADECIKLFHFKSMESFK
jgi:hypothetical protein